MKWLIIKYATLLFALMLLLKTLEHFFFRYQLNIFLYFAIIGSFFLVLGITVTYRLMHSAHSATLTKAAPLDANERAKYSARELEIIDLLSHGYSNKELANLLTLSPNTIKTHLNNLYSKLGVSNRTQAVAEAKLLKLIQ
ncbi:MAG: response regulator transcription factor [Gammaproteobacteria bacterium]|nr:response regulator transcription factor [Gammaproteobacteria bacterium]